jgi:hypothetical protein
VHTANIFVSRMKFLTAGGFFGCGDPVTIFVMSWDDGVCVMGYWKMMATTSRYNLTRSITLYRRAFELTRAIYQPTLRYLLKRKSGNFSSGTSCCQLGKRSNVNRQS